MVPTHVSTDVTCSTSCTSRRQTATHWTTVDTCCYSAAPMDFERLREDGHPEPAHGAQKRYADRVRLFAEDGRSMPRLRHRAFWLLHNCVAHPLLALGSRRGSTLTTEFHEITSRWLNHESMTAYASRRGQFYRVVHVHVPEVAKPVSWVIHNVIAHVAIGLLPCKPTFDFHDWSAKVMAVPGWV